MSTNNQITEEQEHQLVYEYLLSMINEIDLDPTLEQFREQAEREIAEYQENYPELVAEYNFMKHNNE